jgi:hypothetical protein
MRALSAVLCTAVLCSCGPPKRLDQDLQGREKPAAIWYRSDVSHVRRVIPASVEAVWRVLPASVESLQFPGTPTMNPEDRIYVSPWLKIEHRLYPDELNSRYLSCGLTMGGSQPAADEYQVIFAIMTRLTATPAHETEVDIIVDGTAQDMKERSLPVRCNGTGELEETIIRQINSRLGIRMETGSR